MVTFKLYGYNLEFHEDLLKYYQLLYKFNNKAKSIVKLFETKVHTSSNIIKTREEIENCFNSVIDEIISDLSKMDIYDKTHSDFLLANPGYLSWLKAITVYLSTAANTEYRYTLEANKEIENAAQIANSQISGLDFGILTSSVLSAMIYDSMNESKIRKDTEKAQKYFQQQYSSITKAKHQSINSEIDSYVKNTFIPNATAAIYEVILNMLSNYVHIMDEYNIIDLKCIENINENKSSELLKNIDLVDNPKQLIYKSIELCPYNIKAYLLADKYDIFTTDLAKLSNYFGFEEELVQGIIENLNYINSSLPIDKIYSESKQHCENIALIRGTSIKEEFFEIIEPVWDKRVDKLYKLADVCKSNAFAKARFICVDISGNLNKNNYKQALKGYVNKIISCAEIECLENNSNILCYSQISEIFNVNISKHSDLIDCVYDSFEKDADIVFEIIEEEKKEKKQAELDARIKRMQQTNNRLKQDRNKYIIWITIISGIICLILALCAPKDIKYCVKYNHIKNLATLAKEKYGENAAIKIEDIHGEIQTISVWDDIIEKPRIDLILNMYYNIHHDGYATGWYVFCMFLLIPLAWCIYNLKHLDKPLSEEEIRKRCSV